MYERFQWLNNFHTRHMYVVVEEVFINLSKSRNTTLENIILINIYLSDKMLKVSKIQVLIILNNPCQC